MNIKKVLLIGGSGFVGGWVANRLAARGIRVTIPARHRDHAKRPTMLPTVNVVNANINEVAQLDALMQGVDAVINLVGVLHDRASARPYGKRFAEAHVELPTKIIAAMKRAGVRRLVHLSALKAAADAPSGYLRSKAAGEAVVLAAGGELDVTVFRPSVIFGPNDAFLNTFATLLKFLPVLPLAGAGARLQPVYVGDVADAVVDCLENSASFGGCYDMAGPRAYLLRELVNYVGELTGHRRLVLHASTDLANLMACVMGLLPNPPLSKDNLLSLGVDSVTDGWRDYPGWNPRSVESVAPAYLAGIRLKRRMDTYRARAGR